MACASWLMNMGFAGGGTAHTSTVSQRYILKGTDDRYKELIGADDRFLILKGSTDTYSTVEGA